MGNKSVILLTGGAGNIANATIKKYLENECIVIASDIKEKGFEEFENNPNYEYYQCDVTDINSINKLKQLIEEKYNRITHIISMAGDAIGTDIYGIEKVTVEDINKSLQLNLASHIYITTLMLPLLKNEKSIFRPDLAGRLVRADRADRPDRAERADRTERAL